MESSRVNTTRCLRMFRDCIQHINIWIELGLPQIVIGGTIRLDQVEVDKWMHAMSEHLDKS
jgi:hypothetical protein